MVLGERDEAWFAGELVSAQQRLMSAGTVQEFLLVSSARLSAGSATWRTADALANAWAIIDGCDIEVVPVTGELALIGASGVARFRGSPARLNFGDGFAYALAKVLDCPILCKGNDFAATDVRVIRPG